MATRSAADVMATELRPAARPNSNQVRLSHLAAVAAPGLDAYPTGFGARSAENRAANLKASAA